MLLAELDKAAKPVATKEYAEILAFAQKRQLGLTVIPAYSAAYWMELYQREVYGVRLAGGAGVLPFPEVQQGVLDTAARLFHVKFVPVKGLELWESSVSVFDVVDAADGGGGKKLGRIFPGYASAGGKEQVVQRGHHGDRRGRSPTARGPAEWKFCGRRGWRSGG